MSEGKAELGIAFDGDSDRIGAVDEKGQVVFGDMLLLIFGREILSRKPGSTFIGEVKCSQIMYDKLKELGGNPIMYKTGHSLIKAKMKQEHAELAGEMSGHMFFADRYYGYDDAIYAACRLLEIVSKVRQAAFSSDGRHPRLVLNARTARGLSGRNQVQGGLQKSRSWSEAAPPGGGCGWRASSVRAGMGARQSLKYAAGARDAF